MEKVTTNESVVFKYILDNPTYYKNVDKSFFSNKTLSALILIAKRFYDKYKEIPTENQMKALVHDSDKIDIEDELIETVYGIDTDNYDSEWLKRTAESWIKWKFLQKNLVDSVEYAKMTNVTIDNVDTVVQRIVDTVGSSSGVNFNFDEGLDFFEPDSHYQDTSKKIRSGYKYMDSLTGGYDEKTLVCYVGQSNIGKCVCWESEICVRNKKTGETMKIPIGDFFKMIENGKKN